MAGKWLPAVGVLALAAANFLWQLDSPSLYIDEAISWGIASNPMGELLHHVRVDEITPWTYYVGLHEWIGRLGSDDEWVMRLPSALAGIGLVGVVYRLGVLTAGRGAALLAGLLAATSPLLLNYSQQVRAYAFAALLVAVAVWAALEAERAIDERRRQIWLVVVAGSSIGALWVHYTSALVLLPLAAWVARAAFSRRAKLTLAAVVALGALPLLPLWAYQRTQGHEEGIAAAARLTLDNLVQVAGTPFEDRVGKVTVLLGLGAAAFVVAVVIVARSEAARGSLRRLVLPAAVFPYLAVLVATIVSDDALIPRYLVVAAPFMLLLIAGAATAAPRPLAVVLAGAAIIAAVGGSIATHREAGFHPDVRGSFEAIAAGYRDGDAVVLSGYPSIGPVGNYYESHEIHAAPLIRIPGQEGAFRSAVRERRRLWFLSSDIASRAQLRRSLADLGYRLESVQPLTAGQDLQLTLGVPRARAG